MKPRRLIRTIAITGAVALGVWGVAVSFTTFNFSDGDTLSAAQLNSLLNDNFSAAETAITDLENGKFDAAGGTITGRTDIVAPAETVSSLSTVLRVSNTSSTNGTAAVFESNNSSTSGAVSIKQQGTGPALSLKSNGGGPLIAGAGQLNIAFVVEDTGTIKIGNMGPDGSDDPMLTLDAEAGTVTNNVGSGLPLAFGSIEADGSIRSGTSNFSVSTSPSGTTYYIAIEDVSYNTARYTGIANTAGYNNARSITSSGATLPSGGVLAFTPRNADGVAVPDDFYFVVFGPTN